MIQKILYDTSDSVCSHDTITGHSVYRL